MKHYRIKPTETVRYYISPKVTFATVIDLINHYKVSAVLIIVMTLLLILYLYLEYIRWTSGTVEEFVSQNRTARAQEVVL